MQEFALEAEKSFQYGLLFSTIPITIIPSLFFVLVELFRPTKENDKSIKSSCENISEGICLLILVLMWIRWTLPRLRIDQVMTTCLKYCTPIAAVMFAGVMLWQLLLPGGLVAGSFRNAAGVREGWLEQSNSGELDSEGSMSGTIPSRRIVEVSR